MGKGKEVTLIATVAIALWFRAFSAADDGNNSNWLDHSFGHDSTSREEKPPSPPPDQVTNQTYTPVEDLLQDPKNLAFLGFTAATALLVVHKMRENSRSY